MEYKVPREAKPQPRCLRVLPVRVCAVLLLRCILVL